MSTVAKKKPITRQLAFRAPQKLAERTEAVAARLGLDISGFLRQMLVENIGTYEERADKAERKKDRDD